MVVTVLPRVSIGSNWIEGGASGVVQQLGGAHGGAPGAGGQQALLVVGEENGVDQFRLAARKLRDEGDIELVFRQPVEQVLQAQINLAVVQFLFVEPVAIARDAADRRSRQAL